MFDWNILFFFSQGNTNKKHLMEDSCVTFIGVTQLSRISQPPDTKKHTKVKLTKLKLIFAVRVSLVDLWPGHDFFFYIAALISEADGVQREAVPQQDLLDVHIQKSARPNFTSSLSIRLSRSNLLLQENSNAWWGQQTR